MPRQKYHRSRIYQMMGEPGPGSIAVGYVRYSSKMQDPATIVTQKRVISAFVAKKGWKIVRWYEEPEQSAKYEDVEQRPVFAQLLRDAEAEQFQVALCYANNRWSRNTTLTLVSLSRLRKAHVWWATADGLWDLGKTQQEGVEMGFLIDTQMNEVYIRQLSRRTIDGKEDRAREGYHNGWVPFGYLPPEYPKAPDGAPSTWHPPRIPARPDPITFPALVRIGQLAAQGWSDRAIANELEEYASRTPRFGERALTKDTIAAIRRSWFPREFAPGCGHGSIDTPTGELVEGRHHAATAYTARLQQAGVRLSMAEIGAAWQNGYAERLIRTINEEEVDLSEYEDYTDATRQLRHFLDEVSTHKRIPSSLGDVTLAEFEEDWHRKPPPVPVEQERETESHQRKEERMTDEPIRVGDWLLEVDIEATR